MIIRNTIQRTLTYEAVNRLGCHATADEVYEEVKRTHPSISKGTVYRNLHQLSANGDIQKLEIPGGADRFDHRQDSHYHAKCLQCGRVFDMDMEYIGDLEQRIIDSHGFQVNGHDIIFKGFCPECKA